MMFSLSFVWGSKSANGFGPGGSISPSGFGPGGPNLGGSKSAWTPRDDVSSYLKYYQLSSEILDYKIILFRSGQFDRHDMEKKCNSYWYVPKHLNTLRNIRNVVEVLV